MKDPTFWLIARASGLLAYAALTVSTLLGLLVKARPFRSLSRATVTDLHRFVAFTALGALAIHAIALTLDAAMPMPVRALLIPGLSPYRPVWTSAGVIAGELMVLIIASFPLRRLIGAKAWRRLHWATYAAYVLAAVHGIAGGTDTSRPWVMAFYAGTIGAVAAATAWRALVPPPRRVPKAAPVRRLPEPTIEGALP
jgi:sulfoxide reductase heme-binding subunit YedZ